MHVKMELNIPPHFFDSANDENNFESVSERIAKAFLIEILKEEEIKKGNPEIHEPDYVSDFKGYEVTFAIKASLVPQLKGIKTLDSSSYNIEDSLINDITAAIKRKADKNYSCTPSLVVITLSPLLSWYYPLFIKPDPLSEIAWGTMVKRRDEFFDKLYSTYISNHRFENIFLIQPTHDEHFVLFDIKNFGSFSDADFIKKVGVKRKKAFPVCKVINVEHGNFPIIYETTIVIYEEESLNGQA